MFDTYQTLAAPATGDLRDRGSKFLAYAYAVFSEVEAMEHLQQLRKEHPKARHHCYAYRLGLDGNNFRANDDGEPGGTAGRPILGQIDSFQLTNVIVIVVRYFGGTLLGASGLIQAYKGSARAALESAEIVTRTVEDVYLLAFDYAHLSAVMNAVSQLDMSLVAQRFTESAEIDVAIRQTAVADTLHRLKAQVGGLYLEEVGEETEIEGLRITYQYTR